MKSRMLGNKQQALCSCPESQHFLNRSHCRLKLMLILFGLCLLAIPNRQFLRCCQNNANHLHRCLRFYLWSALHFSVRTLPAATRFFWKCIREQWTIGAVLFCWDKQGQLTLSSRCTLVAARLQMSLGIWYSTGVGCRCTICLKKALPGLDGAICML